MKRSILGLVVLGLAAFVSPAGAQVQVGPGGQVDINAGGTTVKTGADGTKVNAGGTKVITNGKGARVSPNGKTIIRANGTKVRKGVNRGRTFVCKGDQTKVLKQAVISVPGGDAIVAKDDCDLTIKGSTIQGKRAIVVKGNATVKIVRSTIQGKHAIYAKGNADVSLGTSVVSGKLTSKGNAEISKKGGNTIR